MKPKNSKGKSHCAFKDRRPDQFQLKKVNSHWTKLILLSGTKSTKRLLFWTIFLVCPVIIAILALSLQAVLELWK